MKISQIIKDAVKYPLLDWKKLLILGVIIVISSITLFLKLGVTNNVLIVFSVGLVLLTGFLVNGYIYRIIKSSLDGAGKLPEFNEWKAMFTDGFKVFIIFIAYLTVPTIIISFLILLLIGLDFSLFEQSYASLVSNGLNPLIFLSSGILQGLENIFIISFDVVPNPFPFVLSYVILIMPIFFVAIANMAYEGEFKDAFRLIEILEIIRDIGLIKLIKWYILTVTIFLTLFIIGDAIAYLLILLNIPSVSIILNLILIPYIYIFYGRVIALLYMPEST
jgi:hypothetical protein